jgi:hypothetical protein
MLLNRLEGSGARGELKYDVANFIKFFPPKVSGKAGYEEDMVEMVAFVSGVKKFLHRYVCRCWRWRPK